MALTVANDDISSDIILCLTSTLPIMSHRILFSQSAGQ